MVRGRAVTRVSICTCPLALTLGVGYDVEGERRDRVSHVPWAGLELRGRGTSIDYKCARKNCCGVGIGIGQWCLNEGRGWGRSVQGSITCVLSIAHSRTAWPALCVACGGAHDIFVITTKEGYVDVCQYSNKPPNVNVADLKIEVSCVCRTCFGCVRMVGLGGWCVW